MRSDQLQAGLEKYGLGAAPGLCDRYRGYIELLDKWNRAYNLVAVKTPGEIVHRHVLDCLSILSCINGKRCIDIGTGAGLPGLILAIAQPDKHWVLLDSNRKKLRFIQHVKAELDIGNVDIVHARVERFRPDEDFDTLVCRAFAPLSRMLDLSRHLVRGNCRLLAMKGRRCDDEIQKLGKHDFKLEVKRLSAASNLVQITAP